MSAIDDGEIYDAEGYTLSLSLGQCHRLKKLGRMYKDGRQWFVNAPYDPEFGLQLGVSEAQAFL